MDGKSRMIDRAKKPCWYLSETFAQTTRGLLSCTSFEHLVFPRVNVNEAGKEVRGRSLFVHAGPNLTPQTVLAPRLLGRLRFVKVRDEGKRLGRNVTKVDSLCTRPSIDCTLDVVLVRLRDQLAVLEVLEFERAVIKDAPDPLRLLEQVNGKDGVNESAADAQGGASYLCFQETKKYQGVTETNRQKEREREKDKCVFVERERTSCQVSKDAGMKTHIHKVQERSEPQRRQKMQ